MTDLDDLLDATKIAPALASLAVPLESVNLDPANARTHNDANLAAIKASLTRFGQRIPIVVQREGMVVRAGNGRVLAARAMDWRQIAAVIVDEGNVDATAFALADNRSGELAEWDDDVLRRTLAALKADGDKPIGWTDDDLAKLLREPVTVDEDQIPPVPRGTPITARGDLWLLGRHRLLCGDATNRVDVAKLLVPVGGRVDFTLTDPPYGVGLAYESHDDTLENLETLVAGFFPIARECSSVVALTPGNHRVGLYPNPDWMLGWFYPGSTALCAWGRNWWQPICVWGADPILAAQHGLEPDAVEIQPRESVDVDHPCPKPAKLWAWIMERVGHEKRDVFDPFAGAGTTFVVAEQTNRTCYGLEIEPRYCDVILERFRLLTGEPCVLASRGDAETMLDLLA